MEFKFWFYVGLLLTMALMAVAGRVAPVCSDLVFFLIFGLGGCVAIRLITYVFWVVKGLTEEIDKLRDQIRDLQKDK